MYQLRFHGRGGQGVVTAAELTAIAAHNNGWYAQAFPHFGVERTGAPIEAFARIDKKAIRTREHVLNPDILVIQDASLLEAVNVTKGCDNKTKAIINTSKPKEEIKINLPSNNVYVIDATKIALDILGKNIVNTIILGALAKSTGLFTLNDLKKAVHQKFSEKDKKLYEKNVTAVTEAFQM